MTYTPIMLREIWEFERDLTHERILELIKQFYAFIFEVTQLHCICGQRGGTDWVFHGIYKKFVYVMGPDGNFVLVTVCLQRYMCTRCHRTITAFPWWLIKGCRYTMHTMVRLIWEHEVLGRSTTEVAVKNGMDPAKFEGYIATYEDQIKRTVPEALRNIEIRTLTVARFGKTRVDGLEDLAVKDLNGLAEFSSKCESITGLPFLQRRIWWKLNVTPKATEKNNHYYGAVPISKYMWFYRKVRLVRP